MTERSLARVVEVLEKRPIEGADRIELVLVPGWQCVTEKDRFQVGDWAVYVEVDAVPPDADEWRWLWMPKSFALVRDAKPGTKVMDKTTGERGVVTSLIEEVVPGEDGPWRKITGVMVNFGDDKVSEGGIHLSSVRRVEPENVVLPRPGNYRLRTVRLRGCLSQGILMRLGELRLVNDQGFETVKLGEDVTDLLNITKYDPDIPGDYADVRAPFPGDVSKTVEPRIQNFQALLDELRGEAYVATLKIDGMSVTYNLNAEGEFHVCGRKHSIVEGNVPHWKMAKKYKVEKVLRDCPTLSIQGELAGPDIIKNKLGLKEVDLFVFNVYDKRTDAYLLYPQMVKFCEAHGLQPVPLVEEGDHFDETLESLLVKAQGKYAGTKNEREGIVIRPRDKYLRSMTRGGRLLSFKVLSNAALLKDSD